MPNVNGKVSRVLPGVVTDSTSTQQRFSRYGEGLVIPISSGLYGIADEGSMYRAMEQVPGTARAAAITASFSATAALIALQNNDAANGKRIYLDYIRLICTVAPASAVSLEFALAIDTTNRYSSGGTALTPVNPNSDIAAAGSIAVVHYGAVVAAAASGNVRYLSRITARKVIPVAGDEFFINCGSQDSPNSSALNGTAPTRYGIPTGPIMVGPTGTILLHMWAPSNVTTAGSYELEMGWWER